MEVIIWAILFVVFVAAEFATVQLVSIWFAFGSLIAMVCAYFFEINFLAQLGVFILASGLLLAITFPLVRKRLVTTKTATNNDLDIGQSATVIEEIDFDNGTGRVTLKGVDWSAVPENEDTIIPKGTIVIVKDVQGSKLVVAEKKTSAVQSV